MLPLKSVILNDHVTYQIRYPKRILWPLKKIFWNSLLTFKIMYFGSLLWHSKSGIWKSLMTFEKKIFWKSLMTFEKKIFWNFHMTFKIRYFERVLWPFKSCILKVSCDLRNQVFWQGPVTYQIILISIQPWKRKSFFSSENLQSFIMYFINTLLTVNYGVQNHFLVILISVISFVLRLKKVFLQAQKNIRLCGIGFWIKVVMKWSQEIKVNEGYFYV